MHSQLLANAGAAAAATTTASTATADGAAAAAAAAAATGDDEYDEATDPSSSSTTTKKKKKKRSKPIKGKLTVTVVAARGLAAGGTDGVSDPFCEVSIRDSHNTELLGHVTKTKKHTFEPEWNETFSFVVDSALGHATLRCMVRDKDGGKSQFLGDLRLPLAQFAADSHSDAWHTLVARAEVPDKPGQVNVACSVAARHVHYSCSHDTH